MVRQEVSWWGSARTGRRGPHRRVQTTTRSASSTTEKPKKRVWRTNESMVVISLWKQLRADASNPCSTVIDAAHRKVSSTIKIRRKRSAKDTPVRLPQWFEKKVSWTDSARTGVEVGAVETSRWTVLSSADDKEIDVQHCQRTDKTSESDRPFGALRAICYRLESSGHTAIINSIRPSTCDPTHSAIFCR